MTMKRKMLALLCLTFGTWQGVMAEEIDVLYMVTTLSSGTKYEVMLTNESTFTGPKMMRQDKTFIINGTTHSSDEIGEIRFEKRTIDAIVHVESDPVEVKESDAVYNLNGQKVCDLATFVSNPSLLPKGIYIVNGKKTVVGR